MYASKNEKCKELKHMHCECKHLKNECTKIRAKVKLALAPAESPGA